jgi:hypothetical protein
LEIYLDYKEVITSLKRAKQWGKTGVFSKGTAQIHFINGTGDMKDATALQIQLASPVSVASCEQSFSKMKLIKYLLSTVSQDRFTILAVFSVGNEVTSSINFSNVIKDFPAIK